MLKDNHVTISGSIKNAIAKVRSVTGVSTKIEVECRNLKEAVEAANVSVDIIMLDNFSPAVSTNLRFLFSKLINEIIGPRQSVQNFKNGFSKHSDRS